MKHIINNDGVEITISDMLYSRLITARDLEGVWCAIVTDINGKYHSVLLQTI